MAMRDWKKKGCLEERLRDHKSSVIHRISADSAEKKSFYRFINNPKVTEECLEKQLYEQCQSRIADKCLAVYSDTCVVGLQNHKNRIKDLAGLSRVSMNGKGRSYGLKIHTGIVEIEGENEIAGVCHNKIMQEEELTERERGVKQSRARKPYEGRQSYRWYESCASSYQLLEQAAHITFVMDREADVIDLMDRLIFPKSNFIIRVNHNRFIETQSGERVKVFEHLKTVVAKGGMQIKVEGNCRKPRIAKLEIRYEKITIPWGVRKITNFRNHPQGVPVTVIEVKEVKHAGYPEEPPLVWRLYQRADINEIKEAKKSITLYKKRWKVEEYFKLMKTDGYNIEGTELTSGKAIRKLLLLIMKASIKVQNLKASRDGKNNMKISEYFDEEEVKCLVKINKKVEGGTKKQQNPYPKEHLAYATWVIARLGGWKGFYQKDRPPGTKTLINGLEKFTTIFEYI